MTYVIWCVYNFKTIYVTIDFEPLVQDRGYDHIMLERVIKYINVKDVAVYLELRLVTLRCGH